SKPFLFHHCINETGKLKNPVFLIFGNVFINSVCNVNQSIKTNNINSSKSCGFWSSDYWTGQFINFLNSQAHFLHLVKKALNAKNSNSISYKCGSIFCNNGSFSEEFFAVTV